MRILLLGDFSGMHAHLAAGLRDLGHAVSVASSGDGWKKLPSDIHLGFDDPGIIRKLHRNLRPFGLLDKLTGFEIVQLQNPVVFPWRFGINSWAVRRIVAGCGRAFLAAAGDDAFFWRHSRAQLRYGPFDDFLKYDLKASIYYLQRDRMYRWNQEVLDMVEHVIPVAYEYWLSYRHSPKVVPAIPLPIDCRVITYRDNRVTGKLRIAHGLIREGFKGTRFIRRALDRMQSKYPNDLEVVYLDRLSYSAFTAALRQTHVLIDQALSHSWGMSALVALAMGKVVLSGAEPEGLQALGLAETPVINIPPDEIGIGIQIESVLAKRESVPELSWQGRQFVERVHDCRIIGQRYIDTWCGS